MAPDMKQESTIEQKDHVQDNIPTAMDIVKLFEGVSYCRAKDTLRSASDLLSNYSVIVSTIESIPAKDSREEFKEMALNSVRSGILNVPYPGEK